MRKKLYLQLFAEGSGDGIGASTGAETGSSVGLAVDAAGKKGRSNPLSDVIYGKQDTQELTTDSANAGKSEPAGKISFDDLIKGQYKEDFQKKTQDIINKRFKETKNLEAKLLLHDNILNLLSDKYGVASDDIQGLQKALEADESFYEQEAIEKGLTVEQLKELKRLERENKAFKADLERTQREQQSKEIYAKWVDEANQLSEKYGLTNFSLEEEVKNPEFTDLLSRGISLETAYKAIHMDEMLTGAMAKTAQEVKKSVVNSIQSNQSRPQENGIKPNTQVFKTDVNALTKADRDEIERRVARGQLISF